MRESQGKQDCGVKSVARHIRGNWHWYEKREETPAHFEGSSKWQSCASVCFMLLSIGSLKLRLIEASCIDKRDFIP